MESRSRSLARWMPLPIALVPGVVFVLVDYAWWVRCQPGTGSPYLTAIVKGGFVSCIVLVGVLLATSTLPRKAGLVASIGFALVVLLAAISYGFPGSSALGCGADTFGA